MVLKDLLPHTLKVTRFGRFLIKAIDCHKEARKRRSSSSSSMMWIPISHGSYVVEVTSGEISVQDTVVVVHKEYIGASEVCLFGIFDGKIADAVTKYMQSHLFDKKLNESRFWREAKDTMKTACNFTNSKMQGNGEVGSAAAVVMSIDRLVAVSVGDYRAVMCSDGLAIRIGKKRSSTCKMPLSFSGITGYKPRSRGAEPLVTAQRIDSQMEFIILASVGVWEVVMDQEAVNLIRHIEDAEEAAECIAKEALTRMSKGNISCLVIRFH